MPPPPPPPGILEVEGDDKSFAWAGFWTLSSNCRCSCDRGAATARIAAERNAAVFSGLEAAAAAAADAGERITLPPVDRPLGG